MTLAKSAVGADAQDACADSSSRSANVTEELRQILQQNRQGKGIGIYSICSANRFVLEAAIQQAQRDGSLLLIESTSNQVNQFGGYTGQTPADFARFVRTLAAAANFPFQRIVLGGDHLGPHVWRKEPAAQAMVKACDLVRDSVFAGYTKIHLDASMYCADDPGDRHRPLPDEIVSSRAAQMCQSAEAAHRSLPAGSPAPLYVIGTEVPIPGGELGPSDAPEPTRVPDLRQTLQLAKKQFDDRGLHAAWERVIAVVVQPGVEFGDATVCSYDRSRASSLPTFVEKHWHGVYEAHSTDYQSPDSLLQMVHDHFAILKVGPWLTFAFREAVFALASVEQEWLGAKTGATLSQIREALEQAMLENPVYWQGYFRGSEAEQRLARKFSYSDRSRYYWPQPSVGAALDRLLANLSAYPAPLSLLHQYLPNQIDQVRCGSLAPKPLHLIHSKIQEVLGVYASACGTKISVNREPQC